MSRPSEKIQRKFIDTIDLEDIEVMSDSGWVPAVSIMKTVPYRVFTVLLEDGRYLECADDHIVFDEHHNEVFVRSLQPGNKIITEDGPVVVIGVQESLLEENMYDIQVDSDEHRYFTNGILSHNTTVLSAYALTQVLCNDNYNILIAANKARTASQIIRNIKKSYELLPPWLQEGIVEWNQTSIAFENGSRIMCVPTTPDAARGFSFQCLAGKEIIYVKNSKYEKQITLEEFSKICDGDIWQIWTPDGWSNFDGLLTSTKETLRVSFTDGTDIVSSVNHKFLKDEGWIEACQLKKGDVLNGKEVEAIEENGTETVYDPVNVAKGSRYWASGVVNHNCVILDEFAFVEPGVADEFFKSIYPTITSGTKSKMIIISTPNGLNHFYTKWVEAEQGRSNFKPLDIHWSEVPGRDENFRKETIMNFSEEYWKQEYESEFLGSGNTLISSVYLKRLTEAFIEPHKEIEEVRYYELPIEGHNYFISVDTSEGKGIDSSAFSVIDITERPFKVVATFNDPNIDSMIFPALIFRTAEYYNEASVLVETRSTGQEIVKALFYDYQYGNLLGAKKQGRSGQVLKGYGQDALGLSTSHTTKLIGCGTLKTLIENDQLIVQDKKIIDELTKFVVDGRSYSAEKGAHDDLVMTLVNFAWATTQAYFQHISDVNVRMTFEDRIKEMIENLPGAGVRIDESEEDEYTEWHSF